MNNILNININIFKNDNRLSFSIKLGCMSLARCLIFEYYDING